MKCENTFSEVSSMGVRSFTESIRRLLRLSTKPGKSDFWMIFKVCSLGTIAIGLYGFIIEFLSVVLSTLQVRISLPHELPIYLAAAIIVTLIMTYAYGKRVGWW